MTDKSFLLETLNKIIGEILLKPRKYLISNNIMPIMLPNLHMHPIKLIIPLRIYKLNKINPLLNILLLVIELIIKKILFPLNCQGINLKI